MELLLRRRTRRARGARAPRGRSRDRAPRRECRGGRARSAPGARVGHERERDDAAVVQAAEPRPSPSQLSASRAIVPRHIRSPPPGREPRPRRSRARRRARSAAVEVVVEHASTAAPSASVPRAASAKCSRKWRRREVRQRSEPHADARDARRAFRRGRPPRSSAPRRASALARARLLLSDQALEVSRTASTTPSTAASTCGVSPTPAAKVAAFDAVDDDALRQPAERARELDRLADAERVRRRAEHVGRHRFAARVERGAPCRARRRTRRRPRSTARPRALPGVDEPRRLLLAREHRRRPSGTRLSEPLGDGEPGGVVAAVAGCRRRSRRPGSRGAPPPGSGSASRTRCRGRSCGSPARTSARSSSSSRSA